MYFRFEDNDFDLRSESYIKTLSKILRIPPDLIVKGVKELLDEGYISNGFLEVKINSLDLV